MRSPGVSPALPGPWSCSVRPRAAAWQSRERQATKVLPWPNCVDLGRGPGPGPAAFRLQGLGPGAGRAPGVCPSAAWGPVGESVKRSLRVPGARPVPGGGARGSTDSPAPPGQRDPGAGTHRRALRRTERGWGNPGLGERSRPRSPCPRRFRPAAGPGSGSEGQRPPRGRHRDGAGQSVPAAIEWQVLSAAREGSTPPGGRRG
ncbi:small nuclear ribonucleoprotein-associated protein B'-like [Platysternon megacephalum]|uniref:Small nuclear ribonucleoprotein-associated protein B'-like n=1 Tax=Platysternon megacephalum TaxID=55544 RepID=A0A4D9DZ26_9SAUR|nr:small nuclear ribonucleoprotein-associated protein B'-like [Platysternon megacephalum]